MIEIHAWVMADAFCLALGMGGLLMLLAYSDSGRRWHLLLSAMLAGLAFLTRYAAVAYPLVCLLGVLIFGAKPFKRRLVDLGLYGLVSLAPMAIWVIIEMIVAGTVGSRSVQPMTGFWPGALTVSSALKELAYLWIPWFFEMSQALGQTLFRFIYVGIGVIAAGALVFAIFRIRKRDPENWQWNSGLKVIILFGLFLILYLSAIIVTYSLTYPTITLNNRMFAPLNAVLLVLLAAILGILFKEYRHWLARLVVAAITLALFVGLFSASRIAISAMARIPQGYAGYKGSALIEYLKDLPPDVPIISDKSPVIQHYVGRPAYPIQEFFSQSGGETWLPFGSDANDEAQRAFREGGGALALFSTIQAEFEGLYGEQAAERYAAFVNGLFLAYDGPQGQVYYWQAPPE